MTLDRLMMCVAFVAAALGAGQGSAQPREPDAAQAAPPSAAPIHGVPFVGWAEAAQLDYLYRSIQNPSLIAVLLMQSRYWGDEPTRVNLLGPRILVKPDWIGDGRDATSIDDLKRSLARGVPVCVTLTLTRDATSLAAEPRTLR
jgi:hypothetical protein